MLNPDLAEKRDADESFARWQKSCHAHVSDTAMEKRKNELYALVRKVIRNELTPLQQQIVYLLWYENKTNLDDRVYYDVRATDMKIPTGEWVHVAVTRDLEAEEWRFYLNGKLSDTVKFSEFTEKQITAMKEVTADHAFKIGNDYRKDQTIYFKGELMSVAVYSDVRSEEEILSDVVKPERDESLLAYYDMKYAEGYEIPDRSGNGINVTNASPTSPDEFVGDGMTFDMSNKYIEKYTSRHQGI